MHVRTVVEKRIVTEAEVSEELFRKIESRVTEGLFAGESNKQLSTQQWQPFTRRWQRKKNER